MPVHPLARSAPLEAFAPGRQHPLALRLVGVAAVLADAAVRWVRRHA